MSYAGLQAANEGLIQQLRESDDAVRQNWLIFLRMLFLHGVVTVENAKLNYLLFLWWLMVFVICKEVYLS